MQTINATETTTVEIADLRVAEIYALNTLGAPYGAQIDTLLAQLREENATRVAGAQQTWVNDLAQLGEVGLRAARWLARNSASAEGCARWALVGDAVERNLD